LRMEKELVELFDKAKKAADASLNDDKSSSGPEVSRCVDSLKQLRKFKVTSEILVSTQVINEGSLLFFIYLI